MTVGYHLGQGVVDHRTVLLHDARGARLSSSAPLSCSTRSWSLSRTGARRARQYCGGCGAAIRPVTLLSSGHFDSDPLGLHFFPQAPLAPLLLRRPPPHYLEPRTASSPAPPQAPHRIKPHTASISPSPHQAPHRLKPCTASIPTHRLKPRATSNPAPPQTPPHLILISQIGQASALHHLFFFVIINIFHLLVFPFSSCSMSFKFRIMFNRINCVSF